jgi:hypothetical protein
MAILAIMELSHKRNIGSSACPNASKPRRLLGVGSPNGAARASPPGGLRSLTQGDGILRRRARTDSPLASLNSRAAPRGSITTAAPSQHGFRRGRRAGARVTCEAARFGRRAFLHLRGNWFFSVAIYTVSPTPLSEAEFAGGLNSIEP